MNLCSYLEESAGEWPLEDEISLEQHFGLLSLLEERQTTLLQSLEGFDFTVDVARHHPDSPAFEGLGIEARSILTLSGEQW